MRFRRLLSALLVYLWVAVAYAAGPVAPVPTPQDPANTIQFIDLWIAGQLNPALTGAGASAAPLISNPEPSNRLAAINYWIAAQLNPILVAGGGSNAPLLPYPPDPSFIIGTFNQWIAWQLNPILANISGFTPLCQASGAFLTRSDVVAAVNAVPAGQAAELANWNADIQTLICNGTTHGWIASLDALYVFAAPSPALGLINIVSQTNSPAVYAQYSSTTLYAQLPMMFTPEVGFTGVKNLMSTNNFISWINTQLDVSTAGNYSQNSASIAACDLNYRWITGSAQYALSASSPGTSSYAGIAPNYAANNVTNYFVNYTTRPGASSSANANGAQGLWLADRSSSTLTSLYNNGAAIGTTTEASGAIPSGQVYAVGALNSATPSSASADTYSEVAIGASLGTSATAPSIEYFNSDIHAYNVKRGLNGC